MDPSFMPYELMHLMEEEGIMDYYGLAYRTMKEQKAAAGWVDEAEEWGLLEQHIDSLLHGSNSDDEDAGEESKRKTDEVSRD
jgi:hypothetical protein